MSEMDSLPHFGFVRLDGFMADDMSVVNAARVSFARNSDKPDEEMSEKDMGLINFLMRERHGTPFEHNSFRFHVKCPIFVAREWFRHRIGSFNEFSARYSEVGESFFIPRHGDVRSQVGKPGSYRFVQMGVEDSTFCVEMIAESNRIAYQTYKELISRNVAKELARAVLPVSTYTEFYWTVNARSMMNFLSLRLSEHAQLEIREYAIRVEHIFADKMPVTYQAWIDNNKVAP